MSSNWILPLYFKFSWNLMEWIKATQNERVWSISEEEMERHHMARASLLGGAGAGDCEGEG